MSAIRLYLDEDCMNRALLTALRQREIDVTTVSEVKREGFADDEQLLWAAQNNRVICTYNIRDFSKLHKQFLAENKAHAGIILMHQDFSIGERLYGLSVLVSSVTAEDISNQMTFLSNYLKRNF
jgi:predicted nuclease of predicted toxin-antitoxin system